MIHYTVSFDKANLHLFSVKLNINFSLKSSQSFSLPNWIPGSYMIRDFAKNIISLSANTKGRSVAIQKSSKSEWELLEDVDCLEINYEVYAWDLSVRSAHLDNLHGFFNGTSLFLAINGYESEKHHVIIEASENAQKYDWKVATAMMPKDVDANGFGKYVSDNYEELIDHPFEIADYDSIEFDVFGVPHQMVFTEAPQNVDWARIEKDVKRICETEVEFFGDEKPPFDSYVFMTFVQKNGFGGLEHMASTALHCSFDDLPVIGEDENKISSEYRTFLSLCCHEYFHNWNVKRIKPSRFIPMDMSKEVHTELMWFFEGITSYYDELLLARSGVIPANDYLDMLAQSLTRVTNTCGRLKQTVTESSFDAWTKFYKQDEGAINNIISYYTKGAMIALCLDHEIRKVSSNKLSLDDLMRLVWNQFGKLNKGLGETQIKQLLKEMTGHSFNEFLDKMLYSTDDPNLVTLFDNLGLELQILSPYLSNEKGGFVNKPKDRKPIPAFGVVHKLEQEGAKIHSVLETSCAATAGLSSGDVIIAIDNVRVSANELDAVISKYAIGTEILVSYFRRERLFHVTVKLTEGLAGICYLSYKEEAPRKQLISWVLGECAQDTQFGQDTQSVQERQKNDKT